jgi:hypothetical protein
MAFVLVLLSGCITIDGPVSATSNPVGEKVGQSSGVVYLGVFGDVDASMRTAAANGGISEISTVDFEVSNMFNVIQTYTTTVTGE